MEISCIRGFCETIYVIATMHNKLFKNGNEQGQLQKQQGGKAKE